MNDPLTKRYYLTVLWGEAGYPEVYEWETAAERFAFMNGVNEADGWDRVRWHEHDEAMDVASIDWEADGDQDLPEPDSFRSLNDE